MPREARELSTWSSAPGVGISGRGRRGDVPGEVLSGDIRIRGRVSSNLVEILFGESPNPLGPVGSWPRAVESNMTS